MRCHIQKRLTYIQFSHDTAHGPHVNRARVVARAKDELGRAVVSRANVRNVWLAWLQHLGWAKVTKLHDAAHGVKKKVLRLEGREINKKDYKKMEKGAVQ